ncbi:PREDICTED: uncharacterized protein LOC104809637 [Tarenaya hassleriana]|uniref:uncharacterized protein LOC104809637 n=1 Tax=Tarenaya hassleriana TaxID=28532 RepID=UPI00053C7086|nr:PREDICTED: uncharacterized protein LOC104809637 [Tarenaya hassleriana]
MESKWRVIFSVMLIASLSIADCVKQSLAAEGQQPQQLPGIPGLFPFPPGVPGLPGFGLPGFGFPDLTKCGSTLFNIPGCLLQISTSIFTGQFGNVGIPCCKELLDLSENCLPSMFPLNPFLPLLKSSCSKAVAAPPAAK